MKRRVVLLLVCLLLAALLYACGGGGGGSDNGPAPSPPPGGNSDWDQMVWDTLSRSGRFEFYQRFHHVFGHNIFFGLLITAATFMLGVRKGTTAALVLLSFHLHLLGDYVGARGYGNDFWAVPYFWPVSSRDWYWSHQWPLNGWQNFVITGILMSLVFYWAWKRGYSPLEMVSVKADKGFVKVLRNRFGNPGKTSVPVS